MTIPPLATRQEESTMAEILVEKLGVPALYLANKVLLLFVIIMIAMQYAKVAGIRVLKQS